MPEVILHRDGRTYRQEVPWNSNLVVLAGIRQFPHLKYGCGMGKCTKCAIKVLAGGEALAEPNGKEIKMLGDRLGEGFRLACQLRITNDLEIAQE